MAWEYLICLCALEAQLAPSDLWPETTRETCYLHSIVQECPRTLETAVLLLFVGQPAQSILDVLLLYEDVMPGLGKGLEDEGCEPEREKKKRPEQA